MNKRTTCAFYLSLLALPALAAAQTAPVPAAAPAASVQQAADVPATEAVTAQILVSGKRPGPGLWKVSKGEHVMWVFGLYSPLPQKMEWDAGRVERLIAQSQEVLQPPVASISTGVFGMLGALPSMIGMKKNPDGATLHDVLPADVYVRWEALKQKYIGSDDGIERERPLFAADALMEAGLKKNGLSQSTEVRKQIEAIARKNDVKLTVTGFSITLDHPGNDLREFKKSQLEDVACFTKTLERFEGNMSALLARGNAWANGNIAEISNLDFAARDDSCSNAVLNGSFAKNNPALQNLPERRNAAWFKAAEGALERNKTSFAMLQINDILGPNSYLVALRAKGYTVDSPK